MDKNPEVFVTETVTVTYKFSWPASRKEDIAKIVREAEYGDNWGEFVSRNAILMSEVTERTIDGIPVL